MFLLLLLSLGLLSPASAAQKSQKALKGTYPFLEPMLGYAFGGLPAQGTFDAVNYKGPRGEFRGGAMFSDWLVVAGRVGFGYYSSSSIGIDTQSGQHIDLASTTAMVVNPSLGLDVGARIPFDSLVGWIWLGFSPLNFYSVPATALTGSTNLTSRSLSVTVEFEMTSTFNLVTTFRADSRSGVPAASSWNIGLGMPIQIGRKIEQVAVSRSRSTIPGVLDLGGFGR